MKESLKHEIIASIISLIISVPLVIMFVNYITSDDSYTSSSEESYSSNEEYSSSDYYSSSSDDDTYSWIVGTWRCNMGSHGTSTITFYGNGRSGRYTEVVTGNDILGTISESGTYTFDGSTINTYDSETPVCTPIPVRGNRLYAGGGYYYTKSY